MDGDSFTIAGPREKFSLFDLGDRHIGVRRQLIAEDHLHLGGFVLGRQQPDEMGLGRQDCDQKHQYREQSFHGEILFAGEGSRETAERLS